MHSKENPRGIPTDDAETSLQTHDAESRLLQLLPGSEQEQQFAGSLMTKPRAGLFTRLLYSGLKMEQACC